MKWIDRWFLKMSKKAWETAQKENEPRIESVGIKSPISSIGTSTSMNLYIHTAVNDGYIVELSTYDNKELYIVNESDKLAEQLASIITQYKLRS